MTVHNRETVLVLTHFPSPYQVELFDAIASDNKYEFEVIYLHQSDKGRQWAKKRLDHKACFLDVDKDTLKKVQQSIEKADLVIFNYYQERPVPLFMKIRDESGKPWCFWGERLGYRLPNMLGRVYRRYKLKRLHRSRSPIWGIGQWAVDTYKEEFGTDRHYFNVPYYSDLKKFQNTNTTCPRNAGINILYSGSLNRRKGIDLLLDVFNDLLLEFDKLKLDIVGEGPLRDLVRQYTNKSKSVIWHGFQSWDSLPGYYAKADILCVPSRYDGWGLVVPEGLASGLPVIATDRMGSALEMIEQGKNGYLVKAGDTNSLYLTLLEAVNLGHQGLADMSQYAKKTASRYGVEQGVVTFTNAVRETLRVWNTM